MNDALPLKFDPSGLVIVNAIVALMIFGASLDLRLEHLRRAVAKSATQYNNAELTYDGTAIGRGQYYLSSGATSDVDFTGDTRNGATAACHSAW